MQLAASCNFCVGANEAGKLAGHGSCGWCSPEIEIDLDDKRGQNHCEFHLSVTFVEKKDVVASIGT
jgi:hypothetical protein